MSTRFVNGQVIDETDFVQSSTGSSDGGKAVVLDDAYGKIDISMIKGGVFGGNGADGALSISSGTTTINLGGERIYVLNYTTLSITGTGALAFSNPHAQGSIVIIKVRGNVTITSSATRAIDLRSLGGAGGGTGATGNGPGGASIINNGNSPSLADGGSVPASDTYTLNDVKITKPTSTVGGVKARNFISIYSKSIELGPGTGGGGGNTNDAGGNGGGALYMECAGSYNVTGTIDASGGNGASTGAGNRGSGGGGGGSIVILYNFLTANTGTYNVAGGTGGVGSSPPTTSGANGGNGYSLIGLNTEFV